MSILSHSFIIGTVFILFTPLNFFVFMEANIKAYGESGALIIGSITPLIGVGLIIHFVYYCHNENKRQNMQSDKPNSTGDKHA